MRALGILRKGLCLGLLLNLVLAASALAQKALTWQEVRDRFEALNPTLRAGLIGIDESKASEITAYLRPNPNLAVTTDGIQAAPYQGVWQPLRGATISPNISYLHERRHKRELRLESAQKATAIAVSTEGDLHRTLISNLRTAFIQVLEEKAILALAKENMAYSDCAPHHCVHFRHPLHDVPFLQVGLAHSRDRSDGAPRRPCCSVSRRDAL
ncbi:MAG: hypothetical protein AUH13_01170 [Acidobacteria bacterium 13_2_20CM_58_27]|nr:MAG: hypothetical protein AUH13_01170 [Acidobacteria bacterium 13_2_20CM_58_27]